MSKQYISKEQPRATPEDWEKRFDKQFPNILGQQVTTDLFSQGGFSDHLIIAHEDLAPAIKQFIRTLLEEERKRTMHVKCGCQCHETMTQASCYKCAMNHIPFLKANLTNPKDGKETK